MNERMNDKGVCRTAPATPGLLKIASEDHLYLYLYLYLPDAYKYTKR